MQYITTSCRNCGYRTRNHESGVPSVQIGHPVGKCPRCGHLILDCICTEYEFMTEKEKKKFNPDTFNDGGNYIFIIVGIILFFGSIATGGGASIMLGLLLSIGCFYMGISRILENKRLKEDEFIEQCVYESLKRTENKYYVNFVEQAYKANGIQRTFKEFENKKEFLEKYNKFETRKSYKDNMNEFNEVLEIIDLKKEASELDEKQVFNKY